MRVKSFGLVIPLAICLFSTSCILLTECKRLRRLPPEDQAFLKLDSRDQLALFKEMPLERQLDLVIKNAKHCHHGKPALSWEVAKKKEKAVPLLEDALQREQHTGVELAIVWTLEMILRQDYDFRDNISLMRLLEKRATQAGPNSVLRKSVDEIVTYPKQ